MRQPDPWHAVFAQMAEAVAKRSKDDSSQCGAVIVDRERRLISCGFNGPPRKLPDSKCPWERPAKYSYILHAEDNAIWFGAQARGIDGLFNATMYVTSRPCSRCVLLAIRAKITEIVYGEHTPVMCDEKDWEVSQTLASLGGLTMYPLRNVV